MACLSTFICHDFDCRINDEPQRTGEDRRISAKRLLFLLLFVTKQEPSPGRFVIRGKAAAAVSR